MSCRSFIGTLNLTNFIQHQGFNKANGSYECKNHIYNKLLTNGMQLLLQSTVKNNSFL